LETERPDRRTFLLLVVPIIAVLVLGTTANALTSPLLKSHPLLLVAGEARNRNLLLTANLIDTVPFVVVGVLRRMLTDPLFFLLGHYYGDRAVIWIQRRLGGAEWLARITQDGFRRFSGLMVFLFPGALVCVLAGASRMKVRTFLVLNFTGTVAIVIVLRLFAHTIEGPIEAVQRFNDRNFKWLTAIGIAGVVGYVLLQRKQRSPEYESISEIERQLEGGDPSQPE
jgi:membrane protein DedA with SNARE-associated domain